ncbi:hypothetical protein OUZ56_030502 [Daphnia magna]|uniref:Uncharacterized protein n=1 Tax=Daphnia magna TaxID=35525 RepID=A0ABQ9ZRH9_9CRUS|nr:hypothetical protein OUZ56_030502 [Daphnia magna]
MEFRVFRLPDATLDWSRRNLNKIKMAEGVPRTSRVGGCLQTGLFKLTRATASETGLGADLCHNLRNGTQFIRSYWTPSFALMSVGGLICGDEEESGRDINREDKMTTPKDDKEIRGRHQMSFVIKNWGEEHNAN